MFRYQMEERDNAFVFFCSQECLQDSQRHGPRIDDSLVTCEACATRFLPTLASQVFYRGDRRHYSCSMACRSQLLSEARGTRLGEVASRASEPRASSHEAASAAAAAPPAAELAPATPVVTAAAPSGASHEARAESPSDAATKSQARAAATSARRPPRRIAVFNHKGGTGKTTTSVSLAAGLADRGYRVLLVDTDSQGNVAVSLGASTERSLYHVLVMGLAVGDAVQTLRPNLDLLPANETLAAAELYLAGRQNRDRVLSQRMTAASDSYDYVVVDCSPSLSLMNQNALVFADSVLIPVACDYLSLVGVRQVIKTVKNVNNLLRHPLQIWGVVPTFFDARAKICVEALETLRGHFGDRCLLPIRATTKLKEAPAQGRSIFEHAPGTYGAEDYAVLVDAVCETRVSAVHARFEAASADQGATRTRVAASG
jgi:chromosome partitioning protein